MKNKRIILVYDNECNYIASVPNYQSIRINKCWNKEGNFDITINAYEDTAKYLKTDRIVDIDGYYGYIKKIEVNKENNANLLVVTGVTLKDNLARVCYPPEGQDTDNYTNSSPEFIVKSLIDKNAGVDAATKRKIDNLVTAANTDKGAIVDYSVRYKDLLTEIYNLLATDKLSIDAVLDKEEKQIVFDVVEGNDVSDSVTLSLDWASIRGYNYTKDYLSYKNIAIAAGQGEGKDRTILEVGDLTETGYARSEVFVDARDIEDDSELEARGIQKLADLQIYKGVSIDYNEVGPYVFGEHFKLGDYVTVEIEEESNIKMQVIESREHYIASTHSIELILDHAPDDIEKTIKTKLQNYDNLVASDTTSLKGFTELYYNADGWDGTGSITVPNFSKCRSLLFKIKGANTHLHMGRTLTQGDTHYASGGGLYLGSTHMFYLCVIHDGKDTLTAPSDGVVAMRASTSRTTGRTTLNDDFRIEYIWGLIQED